MEEVKEFKSEYYDRSFSDKLLGSRITSGIAVFLGTFGIAAVINYNTDELTTVSLIRKILNGFSYMSLSDYLLTTLIAIILVALIILVINARFSDRKIIVGMAFFPENKKLKLKIRNLADSSFTETTNSYSEIKIINERLSDGMTSPMYDCITFERKDEILGHYFKDHKMWDMSERNEIEKEIAKIKDEKIEVQAVTPPTRQAAK